MRPEILFPLFGSVTGLNGVGARTAKLIEAVAGPAIVDLCWHMPTGLIDRRYAPTIADARSGGVATITVTVGEHEKPHNRRSPYRVQVHDQTGQMTLVFFSAREDYLRRMLPEGADRVVSGEIEEYHGIKQMTHPDHMVPLEQRDSVMTVEPVYPLTAKLSHKVLGKAVRQALMLAPELPEWLEPTFLGERGWAGWQEALRVAHSPEEEADLDPRAPPRLRLAYDELLANQLALALVRRSLKQTPGRASAGTGVLRDRLVQSLPYELTAGQKLTIDEILDDLSKPQRMLRLLQGDVGSGKTVVALMSMLCVVEDGRQAAILAPTEILARQHFETITGLTAELGIKVCLLTGRDKGKRRDALLGEIKSGEANVVIGTHALFQEDVSYHDLAFVVIDEQHRFGVHQRLMLAAKGSGPVDVLVMTATPIPRTLTLTAYGDMDVSRLTERLPGRTPIETRAIPNTRLAEIVERVAQAVEADAQVYWVCPRIEDAEDIQIGAEERYRVLREKLGERVGLVHGQMKAGDKDAVMEAFVAGSISVLVATTVIEVGVDVPNATIMVVEHAERFGLAQLHQLRGRVGRGQAHSACLLVYASPLTQTAEQRLRILRETDDGFHIAEEDLRLRGAGELLGTRQSGVPEFRLADLTEHADLLPVARDDMNLALTRDPDLSSERGKALRTLLYLFQRDEAVKYLRSG